MWNFVIAHFWTIAGSVTALGGIGLIVVLILLGIPAAVIIAKVVDFFRAAIEFFKTPLGQAIGIVVLCVISAFVADIHRHQLDIADCKRQIAANDKTWQGRIDTAAEEFKNARSARDQEVDDDLKSVVDAKDAEINALRTKVDNYDGQDHPGCVLTPADLAGVQPEAPAIAPAAVAKPARKLRWNPFRHGS